MLDKFLIDGSGELFYRLSNADGKVWLMPAKGMRTAMGLYQPSGMKGRLLKALFPLLHVLPPVRKAVHAQTMSYALTDELKALLSRVFGTEKLEFALFCGTPCVHQKTTMQLSSGDRILGYCKFSDSDVIAELFRGEAVILDTLHANGLSSVPECLFCGTLSCGTHVFIQSTVKSSRSRIVHEWCALHEEFLTQLYGCTHRAVLFEDSDFCRSLQRFQAHIDWLPENVDGSYIAGLIETVITENKGKTVDYSAFHADFTPWNMFVEQGRLFVFDWEYAAMTYPPQLDRYHFFNQTAVFEKHWGADAIIAYMQSPAASWMDDGLYSMYLFDMFSRYTLRENGRVKGNIADQMQVWFDLLKYLNK
ncbi:MAG: hypothetical protein ACI3ZQ_01555 [Candidatus Cryptobacteroides sp.]